LGHSICGHESSDGKEDLLAAQNYARFPVNNLLQHYPGKILQNYGDTFKPVETVSGGANSLNGSKDYKFGISPIISDFNGDGWPDLVWANLSGESVAHINKGGDRNYIKVRLPNVASSLNAIVTLMDSEGVTHNADQAVHYVSRSWIRSRKRFDIWTWKF